MGKIREAMEYMSRKMKCPLYGKEVCFYRFCKEIPFHSDNMRRLEESLENPEQPSYPKRLRRLRQDDIHARIEKPLGMQELENWVNSQYNYSSIIWDKFTVLCLTEKISCTIENFVEKIKTYLAQKREKKMAGFKTITIT